MFRGIEPAVAKLRERMRSYDGGNVHLVGHSLGALVALEATRGLRDLPNGRIVCIGPPLRGSAVARALTAFPGGRLLLGHSADPLVTGIDPWKGSRGVGVIAGRLPFGLGITLGPLVAPHDGTVSVEETQLPGISDHMQGQGLAHHLMQQLIAFATQQGYQHMSAEILANNTAMLNLAAKLGFELAPSAEDNSLCVAI